ncbi:M20 family peptidase [Acutalibacter sp. 1XD8-33]|uniref:Sapep family Mn(2+)-dependent dipeptidase n=1 Tax=Acutalibacter sp. 1XD8-33 TaxID=2320081 RepID=UPI000EA2E757|nr:Sapep family Mn(2+)-dependent dipeptidase [Acutalibacter sp. 1XD8-33]RKJ40048.1 M20 family peptidase [Acutalibacter sp. 1XD8-33]
MFGEKILEYWDDIVSDLGKLVAIPSVAVPSEGEHPFGDQCARAIDTVVEMAKGYGLEAKNVDYYAAHAEYGLGEGNAVVMAHLDVVPAGEGWDTDPFTMVVKNGKAIGRGVSDDKGAAVVALHCLRALKDAGVKGNRKLRVVFGSAEEIGMADMPYYFSKEQHPDMGFTPDSGYGICHCEKGIIDLNIKAENDSPLIKSFSAGTVVNAVPAKAECQIVCTADEFERLTQAAGGRAASFEITRTEDGARLLAKGKAAHAAGPENGQNAATHTVELLAEVFGKERLGKFFGFIHEKIGLCTTGEKLGVNISDEPSGALTFNLGLLSANSQGCSLTVDIRYPATKDGAWVSETIQKAAKEAGLAYTLLSDAKPLYLPKESPLVTLLSGAYQDIAGEECDIFSMGGGTYARQMFGKGVAFGPGFHDDEPSNAHDVNEQIDLRRFKLHAQICLESMYRMLTAE